jgi:hypothetical protein
MSGHWNQLCSCNAQQAQNLAMMRIHNAGSETTANGLKPSSPWYLSLSSFSLWHPQAIRELSSFLPLLKMSLELHL